MGSEQSAPAQGGTASGPGGAQRPPVDFDYDAYLAGPNQISLAVTSLGGVPGYNAYHSSVLVNDDEFFFDGNGVMTSSNLLSHRHIEQQTGKKAQVTHFGNSKITGSQLKAALENYFRSGSYDLLRKNCNSFSDCALFYCLGKRLPKEYRKMEQLGERYSSMVQSATANAEGESYKPNPAADGFSVEEVIRKIDPAQMWSTPGNVLGGGSSGAAGAEGAPAAPLSVAEMRQKRLEALEKRQGEAAKDTGECAGPTPSQGA